MHQLVQTFCLNSSIFIWFQILFDLVLIIFFNNFLIEFKYFDAPLQNFILTNIIYLNASAKFQSTRGASCNPALMEKCPTLLFNVLALCTQSVVYYFSVLWDVWGVRYYFYEEGASEECGSETSPRKLTQKCVQDNKRYLWH